MCLIWSKVTMPYLRLLQRCSTMKELKQIHAQIILTGLARFSFHTSKILAFCANPDSGDMSYSEKLFNQTTIPTVFDFNAMITGYSKSSLPEKGLSVYVSMRRKGFEPNARTFPALARACGCLYSLCQVHCQTMVFGYGSDVYVITSVINMYSKFGVIDLARQVLEEAPERNVVAWTSLITGYCSNGLVDEARKVFDSMPERNDVSCSAMVSGYVHSNHFNEAIQLFRDIKNCADVRPNKALLTGILNACAAVGAFEEGKWVHSYIDHKWPEYEVELGTALMDFYAKCGQIEDAESIFSKMPRKDVRTWSAMISGYAINGNSQMALHLFYEMERRGPRPNAITFIGVIAACNSESLVNEAWRLFRLMSNVYGIIPEIEHYGCMVDLLARVGEISVAEALIKSMPMEPDGVIWGSLLNGCLVHGHVELGEKVGKLLIELEPQHSGRYILFSNMHAATGSWEDVIRLRKLMKERKIHIFPGWSSIEIDGFVWRFIVQDKSRSESADILRVLNQLKGELMSSCHG